MEDKKKIYPSYLGDFYEANPAKFGNRPAENPESLPGEGL